MRGNLRKLISSLVITLFSIIPFVSFGDIIISDAPKNQTCPHVVWGGGKYLVVWNDARDTIIGDDIYAQFVDSQGTLIDANFRLIPKPYSKALCDICASDSSYLVSFLNEDENHNLYGALISFDGTLASEPFFIDSAGNRGLAWNGEKYLVVNGPWSNYQGRFFSRKGELLGDTFSITSSDDSLSFRRALASNNDNFLAIFASGNFGSTYGIIVPSDSTVIDTPFYIDGGNNGYAAVSSAGGNYFVVRHGNPGWGYLYGRCISSDGNLIDSTLKVSTDLFPVGYPDIASDGEKYLVVWSGDCAGQVDAKIAGQFVSSEGDLIGINFWVTSTLLDYPWQENASCAAGKESYLVVWSEENDSTNDRDIRGALVPFLGVENSKEFLSLKVSQNSPNPFYLHTEIKFNVRKGSAVSFSVFNLAGELVEERNLGYKPPGSYTLSFSPNSLEEKLPQGIYFYSLKINDYIITKKMVLLR